MRVHLNTLFVTTQGAYLAREGDALVVRQDGAIRMRVPIHTLAGVVCFGRVACSPACLALCSGRGVTLSFLTPTGRFVARIEGSVQGNVLLRRTQYRRADDEASSAHLAVAFVLAKIMNARVVLQRGVRDKPALADGPVDAAVKYLKGRLRDLQPEIGLERIRGIEGECARVYFGAFSGLVSAGDDAFAFRARTRRPPLDRMNALLSFLYALLEHDVRSALHGVGLDPAVGFLHRDRPGRPGLALDMMEEFRPILADRIALSLINLRQVQAAGFEIKDGGGVSMDEATRHEVITQYQRRKREIVTHPFLGERTTVGMLVHLQARLLARFLRGDVDAYPPFLYR